MNKLFIIAQLLFLAHLFPCDCEARPEMTIRKRIIHLDNNEAGFIRILLAARTFGGYEDHQNHRQKTNKSKKHPRAEVSLQEALINFYLFGWSFSSIW